MNRPLRNVAQSAIGLLALCTLAVSSSSVRALTLTWVHSGSGNFNDANNWFGQNVPNVNDFVSFEVGAQFPFPNTVTFPNPNPVGITANYATSHLRVRDNGVTFSGSTQAGRGPSTYSVESTTQTEADRSAKRQSFKKPL